MNRLEITNNIIRMFTLVLCSLIALFISSLYIVNTTYTAYAADEKYFNIEFHVPKLGETVHVGAGSCTTDQGDKNSGAKLYTARVFYKSDGTKKSDHKLNRMYCWVTQGSGWCTKSLEDYYYTDNGKKVTYNHPSHPIETEGLPNFATSGKHLHLTMTHYEAKNTWYCPASGKDITCNGITTTKLRSLCNNPGDGDTVILYANFSPKTYNIYYNLNGGTNGPSNTTATYKTTYSIPSTPTREGYDFSGWTISTGQTGTSFTVTGDTTITANWTPKQYTMSYNANGGSNAPSSDTVSYGDGYTINDGSGMSKTGYSFQYWTDQNGTKRYGYIYPVQNNWSFTAQWKAKSYTINLEAGDDASGSGSVYPTYDSSNYSSITIPKRDGYTFLGYYVGNTMLYNSSGYANTGTSYWNSYGNWHYDGDVTAYAEWLEDGPTLNYGTGYDIGGFINVTQTGTYTATMYDVENPNHQIGSSRTMVFDKTTSQTGVAQKFSFGPFYTTANAGKGRSQHVFFVITGPNGQNMKNNISSSGATKNGTYAVYTHDVTAWSNYSTVSLSKSNEWYHKWNDLAMFDNNGAPYEYAIKEANVPGYTSILEGNVETGFKITNSNTSKTKVDVEKIWSDNYDALKKRPSSIKVKLYRSTDGMATKQDTGQSVTLPYNGSWSYTFTDLPKYSGDGTKSNPEYMYDVEEDPVDGYRAYKINSSNGGFSFKLTNKINVTELNVTKEWDDNDDKLGKRDKQITVHLYANGQDTGRTGVLTKDNDWKCTFSDLQKEDDDGRDISYTIKEDMTNEYYKETENTVAPGYPINISIKNKLVKIDIPVTKIWFDVIGDKKTSHPEVVFNLYANGKDTGKTVTLNDGNGFQGKFELLDKYDSSGNEIKYEVKENNVPTGYTKAEKGNMEDGFTITNSSKINIPVEKIWENDEKCGATWMRPNSIKAILLSGTSKNNLTSTGYSLTLDAEHGWKGVFENMPAYDSNNERIYYGVQEEVDDGTKKNYKQKVVDNSSWSNEGGNVTNPSFQIVNTYTGPTFSKIPVRKIWDDSKDIDGLRKPITVTLHSIAKHDIESTGEKTGEDHAVRTATLQYNEDEPESSWTYTFDKLDTDNYTYYVLENETTITNADGTTTNVSNPPDGYTLTSGGNVKKGFWLKNTHVPETTSISIDKKWVDSPSDRVNRPSSVIFDVYNGIDEAPVANITVNANGPDGASGTDDDWTASLSKLPLKKNGTKCDYSVKEREVSGYASSVEEEKNDDNQFTVTNTKQGKTYLKVIKKWDGTPDVDSVKVTLIANGEEAKDTSGNVITTTLTASDNWTHTFTDLDLLDSNGEKIMYSVTEEDIPGWLPKYSYDPSDQESVVITNEKALDIPVEKKWVGDDGTTARPSSVRVNLMAKIHPEAYVAYKRTDGTGMSANLVIGKSYNTRIKSNDGSNITGNIVLYDRDDDEDGNPSEITRIPFTMENGVGTTNAIEYAGKDTDVLIKVESNGKDVTDKISLLTFYTDKTSDTVWESKNIEANSNWKTEFNGLDREDENGLPIEWHVEEENVFGYDSTSSESDGKWVITNTMRKNIQVTKKWEGSTTNTPTSIDVELLADGKVIDKKTLTSASNWTASFTGLQWRNKNGDEISYTVNETAPSGYAVTVTGDAMSGFTVHNVSNYEIPVKKVWDDGSESSSRPSSVNAILYAETPFVASLDATNPDSEWQKKINDALSKAKNGAIDKTTVRYEFENTDDLSGKMMFYLNTGDSSIQSGSIKIEMDKGETASGAFDVALADLPKLSVSVDPGDGNTIYNSIRDDSGLKGRIEFVQNRNSGNVTLNSGNNWSSKFTGLTKYDSDGNLIRYSVDESGVDKTKYIMSITGDADSGFTIKNSTRTKDISVTKIWDDGNDNDMIRPNKITVHLKSNGNEIRTSEIKKQDDGSWNTITFTELPKYDDNGNEISYTVSEDPVNGYTTNITGDATHGFTITNKHDSNIKITVHKEWNDDGDGDQIRPQYVSFSLYKNDETEPYASATVEADPNGDWNTEFENLPVYDIDASGNQSTKKNVYKVVEDAVQGYTSTVQQTGEYAYSVTNTHRSEKISINVNKRWLGTVESHPYDIHINLYQNGNKYGDGMYISSDDKWSGTFTDLPKYKTNSDGTQEEYKYTITEDPVDGYKTEITGDQSNGFVITNIQSLSIPVKKIWNDSGYEDERPESINIELHQNGNTIKTKKISADKNGNWETSFDEIPYSDDDGNVYEYEVVEKTPDGYDCVVSKIGADVDDGFTVTNTKLTDIPVKKIWHDRNDQRKLRPSSITIRLMKNDREGGNTDTKPVVLQETNVTPDANGNWEHVFKNLRCDIVDNCYVEENDVNYYDEKITGNAKEGFTITNTQPYITIPVKKHWEDNKNKNQKRPNKVVFRLSVKDPEQAKKVVIPEDKKTIEVSGDMVNTDWTGEFVDVPSYDSDGKKIVYDVTEDTVKQYTPGAPAGDDESTWVWTNYENSIIEVYKKLDEIDGVDQKVIDDTEFVFDVSLEDKNGNALTQQFRYMIYDKDGNIIEDSNVADGGKIRMKAYQHFAIVNVPESTHYIITEEAARGFAMRDAVNADGQTEIGKTSSVQITNVPAVSMPITGRFGAPLLTFLGALILTSASILMYRRKRAERDDSRKQ